MNNTTLDMLSKSEFRARFSLSKEDLDYIDKKSISVIRKHAFDFINKRLAPALPKNDGKQTPFRGHPVFKAQHATATCCHKCLEKWHRIRKGRELDEDDVARIVRLIMLWIERQR